MFEFIKKLFRRKENMNGVQRNEVESLTFAYLNSEKYKNMRLGKKYYEGKHDILNRIRQVIGEDGVLMPVYNLPNNRIIDNQYSKLVNQKTNYLLSKVPTLQSENSEYVKALNNIFNKQFLKSMKMLGKDCYNYGIGWLHTYYDAVGEFKIKRMDPLEIIPVWKDDDHNELDYIVRLYVVRTYEKGQFKEQTKAEIYTTDGIQYFTWNHNKLTADPEKEPVSYISVETEDGKKLFNWEKLPFIAFRPDELEQPLIIRVKSLQDGINTILSNFQNNMEEDNRNTIIILKDYDGENLGEFRQNLSQYGAVKVGADGGVDTLTIEINAENYKAILDLFKKALIENARGFDSKSDVLGSNPNQMNIQSMYSDIDLDANEMETEFQASFEQLLWFIKKHFINAGIGNFENETVEIIFNRDILINESTVIDDIAKSMGLLSQETLVSQHPYIIDAEKELERIKKEKEETLDIFGDFGKEKPASDIDGEETE